MKTILRSITIAAVLGAIAFTSNAQVRVYVRTRPVEPVVVRPAPPDRHSVWVSGEWAWRGGRYEYVRPHYERIRPGRHEWVPGHWRRVPGGEAWVPGHWR